MIKFTSILFCFLFCVTLVLAQDSPDEAAVKETISNYFAGVTQGDTLRLRKAFHPTASMKYVDYKTNNYTDVAIIDFINRLKASAGKKTDRKTKIVYVNVAGTAAQARLEIDGGTFYFHDFMNLLKINGEWKIVSKIFWREEKVSAGTK
jgi:hypothetical protein